MFILYKSLLKRMIGYPKNLLNSIRNLISQRSKSLCTSTDQVILEKINRVGCITLNRPKQMNTLTIEMFKSIHPKIIEWGNDGNVSMILIRGAGKDTFSAGGDIKSIQNFASGNMQNSASDYFKAGNYYYYNYDYYK